jgi:uncharacterized membrane protein YeaQ/YmgE (transglycosylase-associated protein family)
MGLLSWIIVGGLGGWLAKALMPGEGPQGCIVTVLLGIVGAVVGGWVLSLFGIGGVEDLNIWSIVVSAIGAIIVLAVVRLIRR